MDDQLRLYEEQIMKNNDDISILQFQREEAVKNNKELTCIIEELREAKLEADRSMDASMPENLGNEVIDLQLCELRSTLDEKIEVIHERDASINRMQSDIARLTREYEMTSAQFVEAQKINTSVEQQLRDSQQHCTSLTDKVAKQKELLKELEHSNQEQDMELKKKNDKLSTLVEEIDQLRAVIQHEQKLKEILSQEMEVEKSKYEISCRELQEVVSIKDSNISSLENEIKCLTETLKQEVAAVEDLRKEVKTLQLTLAEGRTEIAVLEDTILKNTLVMQEMQLDKESCSVRILELQNAVEKLSEECKRSSSDLVFTQNLKKNLEKELMESQQCIAKLSEDLERRGVELMQLRSSFGEQEKVLSDKNGMLSSLENEVAHLTEVVQQLQESNEMLSQKIETREDEYQEISNQLKNELATQLDITKMFGNEIERLKKLWKQEEDENACLKKECGSLKSTLTERSAKLTVLEREISENQSMIQEILRDKELLRDSLLESQNEIQNLTEKYQLTSAQLDDERKMKKDIEQQLRQSEIHVKTLTEHQEELENEVQKLKCSYAEQEKLLIAKNEELISSTDEVAQLTADVQKEQQSNKMLSQKVETHKSEYERICIQLEKSVAEQNEKTRKFEEEAKCLTESWNQEKETNASLRVECESLQSSLTEKSAVIDALKKEIARNESVIQEKIGNEELLNVKILDVQNEIQKSINENQLISAQLAAEQSTKKDLEQQLLQSQLQISTLSGDRENQRNEIEKLECLLAEQEAGLTAKNEELSSLKNEVAQLAVAVQEEKKSNEVLCEQVKIQKSDYEKICNDLEKAVAKQNEMTRTFEDEAKFLTESWNQEKDINTSLKRECESLQSLLTEKNEKVDALEVEISRNQSVIQEKQEKEELLNARIIDLINEIRKSTEENKLTSAQLDDERKTKNDLELQLQQSQLCITSLVEDQEKQGNEMEKLKCSYVEQEEVLKAKNEELSTLKNEVSLLSSDIQQERRSNEVLSQQIESLKSDYERICNNLEKVVAERNEKTRKFEEEAKRLTESWNQEKVANDSLKKECESLQSSLTEKSYKIAALEREISRNQSVIKESMEKEESLNAKMLDMQNEIRRSVDECQLISVQLANEQRMKKDVEQTLQQTQLRIATLSDDQKKQGNEVQKLKSFVAEQEEVLAAKNEEVTSLTNEVTQLTSAIQQEQRSNEALSKQIESLKSDNEKICNQQEKTVAEQNEKTRKFEEEAKRLTESWNQEKVANDSLKKECESLQSSLTEKSSKIAALEGEISRNQSVIKESLEKEESLNAKMLDMQNEIQRSVDECQLISMQLANEQKSKKDVEQTLQQTQLLIATLSDDQQKQGNEVQKLKSSVAEQEQVLAAKTEEVTSLTNEVTQLTSAIQQEQRSNEALSKQIESLKSDNEKICNQQEKTVAEQNEKTRKFEEEAKCLTESWNQEKETNASLRVENESLQSSLTEKSSKIDALEDEISRNKLEVQEKQEKEELLNKRIVDLQNEIQKSIKECQLISAQLADEQTMKKEVEQQLQQSQLRISKLSDDLTALETLHKEQEEMLAVKTERLSSLESQFAQLEAVKKDIEEDNLKCKETIQTLEADLLKYSQSNEVTDAKLMKILEQKNVVEERLAILEKELEVAGNSTNAKEKEYELEKANTQTVISSLQGEVERLTNDNLSAKSRISSLDQEVDSLNRRLLNSSMDLDIKNETVLMMQTTISSLNSKVDQLEAETKSKDCALATAIANLQETKTEFEKYREEIKRTTDKRLEEGAAAVRRKDDELVNLLRKNETLNERIAFLSEELLQVSQTFNSEKTSLMDHAKNLEEMLESARTTEERLSDEIVTLKDQLRLKELKLSRNDEKMSLSQELHSIEKREWVNKNTSLQSQLDENKIKCDRLMKELDEANVEQLIGKISRLEAESQELRDKLELKLKDVQWYAHELEVLQKSASNTMKVNQQLEEEVEFLTKSKLKEVTRLEKEIATLSQNSKQLGTDHASDISAKLRQEYEDKLERLKAKMRKIYTEKMEKMMKYQTGDEKVYADEELRKEKQKRHALESRVRELSDQLLIVQEEKRKLVSNNGFLTPVYRVGGGPIANPAYESPPIHKSHSLDRLSVAGSYGLDNLGADHLDQSFNKNGNLDRSFGSRRTSTSSNRSSHLPKGIGKVFPAAEEDGEVFDNRCLSDLKDGVCRLPGPGGMDDRMSILQQRNSMCPPHLKSSYPVESQFFATNAKEDEIKLQRCSAKTLEFLRLKKNTSLLTQV
ncbi:hypothetical protein GE061_012143 [Apolygus lucorum]|uniref:Uncharacterized protein n=1 Tax=Apolygus lucorum TaxID=248454 RepID=A0A8S9XRI7_APOLU|nr:hypothetical protein GE061_012143 [Apolygus lucorum]